MFCILVLTDFSEAATYAASYACVLARQLDCRKIVFYHAYQKSISSSTAISVESDETGLKQEALKRLRALGDSLKAMVPEDTSLQYQADMLSLEQVNGIAEETGAEMIVMGTTGKTKIEKMLVGSHAMLVCKTSRLPVALVPPRICMDPVQHIVFACDYKEMVETLPTAMIKKMLDAFHIPVSVVKVNKKDVAADDDPAGIKLLEEILDQYAPDYHSVQNGEAAAGILEFADSHKASLILLVARKYNFTEGLFHKSVTNQLVFDTPIPLLVLQEKEKKE